jgi:hypothetical protein
MRPVRVLSRKCASTTTSTSRRIIYTGPSIKANYDEALHKLNIGLGCHVAGGSLMLLSSSLIGASPLPAAVFGGLLWMQIMSTAKVTELGAWVNLCKNIVQIERIEHDGERIELGPKERLIIKTDGSKVSLHLDDLGTARTESIDEEPSLPSLHQLQTLGIIHVDRNSLLDSEPICQQLFEREDLVVTLDETSKLIFPPPPGAANAVVPKLAEIFQKRQKAITGSNKRLAEMIANAPPMDPAKMIDRLGTASLAMGFAVLVLGAGMYLASSSSPPTQRKDTRRDLTSQPSSA